MSTFCPRCQTPHPQHQLTCRRCGQYLTEQGEIIYASSPFKKWLIIGVCVGLLGFGIWWQQKRAKNHPVQTQTVSAVDESAAKPSDAGKPVRKKKRRHR